MVVHPSAFNDHFGGIHHFQTHPCIMNFYHGIQGTGKPRIAMWGSKRAHLWLKFPCLAPGKKQAVWQLGCKQIADIIWLVVSNIFIFHNIWDNPFHWLIFFKMIKTTNQLYTVIIWGLLQWWVSQNHGCFNTKLIQWLGLNGGNPLP